MLRINSKARIEARESEKAGVDIRGRKGMDPPESDSNMDDKEAIRCKLHSKNRASRISSWMEHGIGNKLRNNR
jgi:hypothetical protein